MNILPSVLIIDNDLNSLAYLKNSFETLGYQAITTADSMVATELFNTHKPTIVVLNIFMWGKDGFEVTKEIREICKKSLIVAISFEERYLRMIKTLGANEAFPKQIDAKTLAQKIHQLQEIILTTQQESHHQNDAVLIA